MDEREYLADQFEAHRSHLRAVAFRMLGSPSEADDALQEAWLRLQRADSSQIENLGGWLTTVVGRVCLDALRSRSARREVSLGPHVPEPIVSPEDGVDPEHEALLADSVGLALMVVMETLTPAERLAFVLHDMFGLPFDEIAPIVDRSPAAARKLASRARLRVRGAPEPDADLAEQRRVVDAFLAAARGGNFDALLELLDPEVVLRVDRGDRAARGPGELVGVGDVSAALGRFTGGARFARPVLVNGAPGFVVIPRDRPIALVGFTVVGGKIVEIDVIADRARLRELDLSGLETS